MTAIPIHSIRGIKHLSYFVPFMDYRLPCKPTNVLLAIAEFVMYLLEIIGITAIYETITEWVNWSTRSLNTKEIELSESIFGDSIDYSRVRLHSNAKFTANRLALAYVSLNTINHYRPISEDVFVHEMVHIWQYQHLGAVYAIKALYAQYRGNAYDYGGMENLYQAMLQKRSLLSFNFEQQAEIIQDYSRLSKLNALNPLAESIYLYFVNQLKHSVA